jgi:hypothetical protein
MKMIFRSYLASLREREELDAILPDLLSELGFVVFSRPQRGTAQAGVDIAAVGKDEDGEQKIFLFSVKQGDLTRQSWDGTPQDLRSSLNEILDSYIPNKIPKRYQDLKIVICLVFGGDMQEQVRSTVTGFIKRNTTAKISFDEWNGDRVAGLLVQGVLREEVMPKNVRSLFQKSIALVDEPDISYQHFKQMVNELRKGATDIKSEVRIIRQLYIALWVLFVWARDIDNVEAPYRLSELVLLHIWDIMRRHFHLKRSSSRRSAAVVLYHTIQLHLTISTELLEKKIIPHVDKEYGISIAIKTQSAVDVNIKLFDLLGRIGLTGLWLHWLTNQISDQKQRQVAFDRISGLATVGYKLIDKNRALFLPLRDSQSIEIALFLVFCGVSKANIEDMRLWLHEMVDRLVLTVQTHGRYPCVFEDYRDLVAHPRERTEEYRKIATAGSTLIPLLSVFLSDLDDKGALKKLFELKKKELEHCTLQVWMPDLSTEMGIYHGELDHGVAICELPLSETGDELIETIKEACKNGMQLESLSAVERQNWPIILTACRHYRLPIPPQFWMNVI